MELVDYILIVGVLTLIAMPINIKSQDDIGGKFFVFLGANWVLSCLYCGYVYLDDGYTNHIHFVQENFNAVTYAGGSFCLFMMVFFFGDAMFQRKRMYIDENTSPDSLRKLADSIEKRQ